jgi:hypothetical protein
LVGARLLCRRYDMSDKTKTASKSAPTSSKKLEKDLLAAVRKDCPA